jgi:hypothetical protein
MDFPSFPLENISFLRLVLPEMALFAAILSGIKGVVGRDLSC